MAKKKKGKKERRIKSATAACLAESGYAVAAWRPAPRALQAERRAERRAARAQPKR
jgi:predicted dienelactone hydrolase